MRSGCSGMIVPYPNRRLRHGRRLTMTTISRSKSPRPLLFSSSGTGVSCPLSVGALLAFFLRDFRAAFVRREARRHRGPVHVPARACLGAAGKPYVRSCTTTFGRFLKVESRSAAPHPDRQFRLPCNRRYQVLQKEICELLAPRSFLSRFSTKTECVMPSR